MGSGEGHRTKVCATARSDDPALKQNPRTIS
jgi:hypothetical protein